MAGLVEPLERTPLGSGCSRLGLLCRDLLRIPFGEMGEQLRAFHSDMKLLSLGLSSLSAGLIFWSSRNRGMERRVVGSSADGAPTVTLYSHYDSDLYSIGMPICSHSVPDPDLISFLLALAIFLHTVAFVMESFVTVGKIIGTDMPGKYTRFIVRMLYEILAWFFVFILFLVLFALSMHVMYPVVPQFRMFPDAVIALGILSVTGQPLEGFPPPFEEWFLWSASPTWPSVGMLGSLNGMGFFVLYMMWIFMSVVLLLNLLIALMSDAFDRIKTRASLEYRLGFARRVLRAELLACRAVGRTYASRLLRVGDEPEGGPYYFTYVEVGRNAEGRKVQDGDDMFADSEDDEVEVAHGSRSHLG